MCSDAILIQAEGLGKCYQLYDKPHHRLFQTLCRGRRQFYHEFWALRDITFSLRRGESMGIIGRNGAGKSTLLQLLSGVLNPSTGTVAVNGRVAALLELGSGFNPEFTGRENAYLNGTLLGLSREQMDQAMPEIERFADIGDFFDRPVKLYSSGMMVRVAFAVQVMIKPDILIVDEALAVGDALFQRRCYQRMENLLRDGTSLLFVSHDTDSVNLFTQHSILLDRGQCLESGPSKQVSLSYQRLLASDHEAYMAAQLQAGVRLEETASETSFDFGLVSVDEVVVRDGNFEKKSVFRPGETMVIDLTVTMRATLSKLFFTVRLINRKGVKIHSWGTWNQDVRAAHEQWPGQLFMDMEFREGQTYTLRYTCQCSLGPDVYEVQVAAALVDSLKSGGVQDLCWHHETAFFEVKPLPHRPFGGVCDMDMRVGLHAATPGPEPASELGEV